MQDRQFKKNEIIELTIEDIGINGEGIGRFNDYAFFVKDALKGDRVRAVITKVNKGYGFAKALEILELSPYRVEPACKNAAKCGGCQIMQLDYREQLKFKESKVFNNLTRIGGVKDFKFGPIIGMETESMPLHFRNKVQFPVGKTSDGKVISGFYAGRTHCIIETESCPVSSEAADKILKTICRFVQENNISVYDEKTGRGLVRHVLIRNSAATGQIMVCLVINGNSLKNSDRFIEALLKTDKNISSICLNVNKENTNVILGQEIILLYGQDFIEEKIGELTFRVSPLAFFQVNSVQTEKLYNKALEFADLKGDETVWDLYCGTGTISLFLAQRAKQVYGVEIIDAAIDNANENARINNISNAEFFVGESEKIFPAKCKEKKYKADVVVLDPPRKGCGKELLDAILETEPEKIVYVSCDSATLARDVKILSEKYRLVEAVPVDMFPHTVHVETVVCLSNKNSKKKDYVEIGLDAEDYYHIKDLKRKF